MKASLLFILSLYLLLFAGSLFSQDVRETMAKVSKTYANAENIRFSVKVKSTTTIPETFSMEGDGVYEKSGRRIHLRMMGVESLINDQFTLTINHNEKLIEVGRNETKRQPQKGVMNSAEIDTAILSKMAKLGCFEGKDKYGLHFVFQEQNTAIQRTDIWIDPANYSLLRTEYIYNKKVTQSDQRVIIIYSAYNFKPQFTKDTFSENRFILRKNDGWVSAPSLKGYEVFEQQNISLERINQIINED